MSTASALSDHYANWPIFGLRTARFNRIDDDDDEAR